MSVRAILIVAFGLLMSALAGQTVVAFLQTREVAALRESEERRFVSHVLADELRQSSDDLTRFARTYAVTGDERFETYFREVLWIRDGEKSRPEGYHGIFWDFVAATHDLPDERQRKVSLLDLMREQGFTAAELAKLETAKQRSDALVELEDRAMAAMKEASDSEDSGPTLARRLLHGPEYHAAKAAIMEPIQDFFDLVEARTKADVAAHRSRGATLGWTSLAIAILAGLLALGGYFKITQRILRPVVEVGDRLQGMSADMQSTSQQQQAGAAEQSASVEETRQTFATLLAATESLSRVGAEVLEYAELAQQSAHTIEERIHELTKSTASISEILGIVKEIANKSEILALNAALEGTKAGEAGRGFSLVASQMQRLAEQVMGSAKKIEELTDEIKRTSSGAVLAAEETGKVAGRTTGAAREIADAVTRQQSGAEQISTAMDEIASVAQGSVDASREIVAAANDLIGLAESLHETLHGRDGRALGS